MKLHGIVHENLNYYRTSLIVTGNSTQGLPSKKQFTPQIVLEFEIILFL